MTQSNTKYLQVPYTNDRRQELIQHIINNISAKSYLEIGCHMDHTFSIIECLHKVGVDPLCGGTIRMSSNDFFKENQEIFDVIFVDGLHHYDQVTQDINNALACLSDHGFIIVHDMFPIAETQTLVPKPENHWGAWLGDVWRAGFDLMARSDITFKLLAMDSGCGIITKQPQAPKIVKVNPTWDWYKDHWQELPVITYNDFIKSAAYDLM